MPFINTDHIIFVSYRLNLTRVGGEGVENIVVNMTTGALTYMWFSLLATT